MVFILAIGYYITPALVGGSKGQLISNMIAYHMQTSLNWGLAAALAVILLVGIIALYVFLRPRGGYRPHEAGLMLGRWVYLAFCTAAFVFLVAPILVIVPLSFNAEPYFTFTEGMFAPRPGGVFAALVPQHL